MRSFVNFIKFKIAPILFSVILLLFLPLHSLNVQASAIAIPSNLGVGFDLYSVFRLFNLTGGLNTPSIEELPNHDELIEAGFTEEQYDALTSVQFDRMDSFSSGLGSTIKKAISDAVKHGTFRISYQVYSLYRAFIASETDSQIGSSVVTGSVSSSAAYYPANTPFTISCVTTSGASTPDSFTPSFDYFVFSSCCNSINDINYVEFVIYPVEYVPRNVNLYNSVSTSPGSLVYNSKSSASDINAGSHVRIKLNRYDGVSKITSYSCPFTFEFGDYQSSYYPYCADTVISLRSSGGIVSSSVSSSLVSNDDVLSSTNSIDSDGVISGDLTIPLPDFSTLNDILNDLRSGVIDFSSAISSLGLSSVSSDSTTEEKEAALSSVVSPIVSALTVQEAGQTTVDQATNELSESLTNVEAAEDTFRPYYDPESEDQDYVPNWFLDLPDLENPENDDSDDNHLVEIVQAIPVVTGLLTDLFDSSGPFKLLFYVGITFVIFSVLVGMAHFIGSYGDRKVLTSSPKVLIGSSNVPLITRKKG